MSFYGVLVVLYKCLQVVYIIFTKITQDKVRPLALFSPFTPVGMGIYFIQRNRKGLTGYRADGNYRAERQAYRCSELFLVRGTSYQKRYHTNLDHQSQSLPQTLSRHPHLHHYSCGRLETRSRVQLKHNKMRASLGRPRGVNH